MVDHGLATPVDTLRGIRSADPDRGQHFRVNRPPVLVEVDRPSLNPKSLKPDLGPQRFLAHLRVEQNAFVPGSGRPGGLTVPQVGEQLVEVVGVQLAGAGAASAGERVGVELSCPG